MSKDLDIKEKRIRSIALTYYSRKDILQEIFKFSQSREVSPRYFDGFGKRPDIFQYPSDILALARKGATSFHCSEELWENPLSISLDLKEEQFNELRKGWDLVIDIDCNWIDYSKKAALAIVKALESHGVENVGIKFSGSKGFHIIIPWAAFPETLGEEKTSDMFPQWPRAIVNYLKELSRPILQDMIKDMKDDFKDVKGYTGIKCETCNNLAEENFRFTIRCPKCYPPHIEIFKTSNKEYRKRKCPTCHTQLEETNSEKFYYCSRCELDSFNDKENFNETILATDLFKILGLDVLLVSPRHLFRMPYSLHEKTSLASVVIAKDKIEEFSFKDAHPLNVNVMSFMPKANKDEARELLIHAIDFQKSQDAKTESKKVKYDKIEGDKERKFEKIPLDQIKDWNFPPTIQKILKGMNDGKKRSVFILINFFRSLGMEIDEVEKRLNEWNEKNKPKLKQGYINAQLSWHSKHKIVLPPNFDNEIYKAIGVYEMDFLSKKSRNPVNYVRMKTFKPKGKRK